MSQPWTEEREQQVRRWLDGLLAERGLYDHPEPLPRPIRLLLEAVATLDAARGNLPKAPPKRRTRPICRDAILDVMEPEPIRQWTARELSEATGRLYHTVAARLTEMARDGEVVRLGRERWALPAPPEALTPKPQHVPATRSDGLARFTRGPTPPVKTAPSKKKRAGSAPPVPAPAAPRKSA